MCVIYFEDELSILDCFDHYVVRRDSVGVMDSLFGFLIEVIANFECLVYEVGFVIFVACEGCFDFESSIFFFKIDVDNVEF